MKSSLTLLTTALLMIFTTQSGWSQLESRGEALIERYDEDRAKGLIRLNETYLRQLREEMATATRAARLEEATALKLKVDALEAENQEMAKVLAGTEEKPLEADANPLLGKTLHFPHNRDPNFTARLAFKEDGKVNWIGLGDAKVEWNYEQGETPLIYHAWMGDEKGNALTVITVNQDISEALVTWPTGSTANAEIKRSTRDEEEEP